MTVFCTVAAIVVALLLPREYRTELIMLPPLAETMEKLNVYDLGEGSDSYFFKVEEQELYQELIYNLKSSRLQRQFYDENKLSQFLKKRRYAV